MTSFPPLVDLFCCRARASGYSSCTIRNLQAHLRQFVRFLDERQIVDAELITENVMVEYQAWLHRLPTQRGFPRRTTTLNRGLSAVRALFKFSHARGYLPCNPSVALVLAREPRTLPHQVLSPEEAKVVIESVPTSSIKSIRDRTILEVLYTTGIRKSELIHLALDDLNLEDELLTVRSGKGGHDRVVPMGQAATRCISRFIKAVRPSFPHAAISKNVFLSCRGGPLGATTLSMIIQQCAASVGVREYMNCHLWRHTCATHMVQNRINLRHLQEMLGHQQLETTQRYLHLTISDLKRAHHRYHPREIGLARARATRQTRQCDAETILAKGTPATL